LTAVLIEVPLDAIQVRYPMNFCTEPPKISAKLNATALLTGRFPDSIAEI
jgi:hypothetical protein